jgi:hypothetical protein
MTQASIEHQISNTTAWIDFVYGDLGKSSNEAFCASRPVAIGIELPESSGQECFRIAGGAMRCDKETTMYIRNDVREKMGFARYKNRGKNEWCW